MPQETWRYSTLVEDSQHSPLIIFYVPDDVHSCGENHAARNMALAIVKSNQL
ncbi:hypothetical protein [Loigolactobacillus zhaoyuanensis]|uniref:Uncharacterized protein n=1 Tax=Loigolactobacillus zhaoyuanensis TaxID=2486017 RepID=A0ABW8UAX6_9LACO|nr:hypothetical protein [Loigolactobacillus zhaoyuanensis]